MLARGVDVLLAERVHDVGALEQAALLLRCQAVLDIPILEDLCEVATSPVLTRHVRNHLLLSRTAREEK